MFCPKCGGKFEEISDKEPGEGYRCKQCSGLWFQRESNLSEVSDETARSLDRGDATIGKIYDLMSNINCPTCKIKLVSINEPDQDHIHYEICRNCFGVYFDAGEFSDFVIKADNLSRIHDFVEKLVNKILYLVAISLIISITNCESFSRKRLPSASKSSEPTRETKPVSQKIQNQTRSKIVEYAGVQYRAVTVVPEHIELILNNENGDRIQTFSNARKVATKRFQTTPFGIMNGGIFEPGETPTGLHIEAYKTLNPLNVKKGKGNFFTKPNGVFFVDKTVRILSTTEYMQRERKARIAVQSGPLLLRSKQIMKHFSKNNPSRKTRNGVCTKNGKSIFLISISDAKKPNMYDFAMAFKKMGCSDALYLDGTISKLVLSDEPSNWGERFGAFFIFL